jgi:hypothetical protein
MGLTFIWGRYAGCGRSEVSSVTPANLTRTGEYVGDRLLLSMVVNAGARTELDVEQSAP